MEKADITIIGAGVVGLSMAAELSRPELSVLILEKNSRHGEGISSRNSEVIHGGMYYPHESLKARLCVEGRQMLYEIAAKNPIAYKKIGKLIVAVAPEEVEELERLYKNGLQNGVSSLSMISKRNIIRVEPNVRAEAALYSPETGIISVHDLMNYFLSQALNKKAALVCNTEVSRIEKEAIDWRIMTRNSKGESFEFSSAIVINCAGLSSDIIANMTGGNYLLYYCKGDYCSIADVKPGTVQRLIYPVPAKNQVGLGVHLTLDLNGRYKLGPDTTYIDRKEDYTIAPDKAAQFYWNASKFLPFLKEENVSPDMAGIRPKLQGPNDDFRDFVIKEDAPGFINLVGIESPGLTASPAIARYVNTILDGKLRS
jgi:L-2-hydroxyglutarate oxidase LhgO